jgi:hypothetical protein
MFFGGSNSGGTQRSSAIKLPRMEAEFWQRPGH